MLGANGKVGYYSSSREGGLGGQDIYKVILKDEMVKWHVLNAKITVNDKEELPISKITLIENESKKVKGIYKPNSLSGKFIMLIDPEKTYNIVIEAADYHSFTSELEYDIKSNDLLEYKLEKKTNK